MLVLSVKRPVHTHLSAEIASIGRGVRNRHDVGLLLADETSTLNRGTIVVEKTPRDAWRPAWIHNRVMAVPGLADHLALDR